MEVDDEKEDLKEKEERYNGYVKLFKRLGKKESDKLINYFQYKVVSFGLDYGNPRRIKKIEELRDMMKPYKDVFGKDMI